MSSTSETKKPETKAVSFEHEMGFLTTRVEVETPNQKSVGTAFLFTAPLKEGSGGLLLLISNKHVFMDPKHRLRISYNTCDDAGKPKYGSSKKFKQTNFEEIYFAHPDADVDLACINVSEIALTNVFYRSLDAKFLKPVNLQQVALASRVIFVGYPVGYYDKVNNLPIVRSGVIASMPGVDFEGKKELLIDAQVFEGSSGSPVFVPVGASYVLLGVLSHAISKTSKVVSMPAKLDQLGIQQLVGLGVVIKQQRVQELVDYVVSEYIKRKSQQKK